MAKYKMSPNEIERLLQEEKNRRRKERLLQVREQAKLRAASVRNAVRSEKDNQLDILARKTEILLHDEKYKKVVSLEEELQDSINTIGISHRDAISQEPRFERDSEREKENSKRARQRHVVALKRQNEEVQDKELKDNQHIIARQAALEVEKERAARIAALPPPAIDPISKIGPLKIKPVPLTYSTAYSSTYYHIPDQVSVEKAEMYGQMDAHEAAKEEAERIQERDDERKRDKHEQREKARVRHKNALQKEIIRQDYAQMLHDMSDLQRENQRKRQNTVAKIPKQIFAPPSLHILENQQHQRKVAQAFEDMYMAATDQMGDISVAISSAQSYE